MMEPRRLERLDVCESLEQLLRTMLSGVVDDVDALAISSGGEDLVIVFTVTAMQNRNGRNETGRIVGKQGQTIASLRRILYITAIKYNYRAVLELADVQQREPCSSVP